jgi:hypothetical protein
VNTDAILENCRVRRTKASIQGNKTLLQTSKMDGDPTLTEEVRSVVSSGNRVETKLTSRGGHRGIMN